MKKILSLLLAFLLAGATPALAAIDAVDPVPAATVLLPYFEVDLLNPNGAQTSFHFGNSGITPVVARVTLWTDRGVPTYAFDVVMPANDLVEVDLRLLFVRGLIPQSTPGAFASCVAQLPPAQLDTATLTALQRAHTGQSSTLLGGNCGASTQGDNKARGFVTVDAANACSAPTFNPTSAGYFAVATAQNVLWGDYSMTDRANNFAHADTLVHLEAGVGDYAAGDYTFYGRLVSESAADAREPLPQQWAARYDLDNRFDGTDALVWRDGWPRSSFPCAAPPAGLGVDGVVVFDNEEQVSTDTTPSSLSLAAQRVHLGVSSNITIPFNAGWLFYDLGRRAPTFSGSAFGTFNQGFVSHIYRSASGFAGQLTAWPMYPLGVDFGVFSDLKNPQCSDGADNDGDGQTDFPADTGCRNAYGVERPACSDGIDNDADGQVDFPNDPECWGPLDNIESFNTHCDDGIDNDGDGLIDFPADAGCSGVFDSNEGFGLCSDGVDNDGDGLIDFPNDPGCTSVNDNNEINPACNDGVDNDGDGLTDFPNDPGCTSLADDNEIQPPCMDGADNDGDGLIDFPADPGCANATQTTEAPQCNDGVSNDLDGLIDMADPGCASPSSDTESPQCNDGIDNDGDGQIDGADVGCSSASDTNENAPCSDGVDNDGDGQIDYPNETDCSTGSDISEAPDCSDGQDNDGDGLVDFPADPGCASALDRNEFAGATARACSDGIDSDGDGLVDFPADPGCQSRYDDSEFNQ